MQRSKPPLRLAVLGCGAAARMHARTLLRRFGAEVELLYASRDPLRAREYAQSCGGSGCYGSYDAAVAAPEVDAVLITTPPATHLELAVSALEAGKDVIVEKPAFLDGTEFDAVRAVQRRAGRRVLVAENYAYKPVVRELRRLIGAGAVGEVLLVTVNALRRQQASGWRGDLSVAGGGPLFEGGIHWVSLMAELGLTVVTASGLQPGGGRARSQSTVATFQYAEGAVGTLLYSWEVPSLLRGASLSRVHGREGSITFESNGALVLTWGRRRAAALTGIRDGGGFGAMFRDFLNVLRHDGSPSYGLDAAQRDVELVRAIAAGASAS